MTWIIKRRQEGALRDEYLWAPSGNDLNSWRPQQGGAWRFADRSEAFRQAHTANVWCGQPTARLVRLVKRRSPQDTHTTKGDKGNG